MPMAYCPTTHPINTVTNRPNAHTQNRKTVLISACLRRGASIERTKKGKNRNVLKSKSKPKDRHANNTPPRTPIHIYHHHPTTPPHAPPTPHSHAHCPWHSCRRRHPAAAARSPRDHSQRRKSAPSVRPARAAPQHVAAASQPHRISPPRIIHTSHASQRRA